MSGSRSCETQMPRVIKYSVIATRTVSSTVRLCLLGFFFLLVASTAFGFGALIARRDISVFGNVVVDSFDSNDPNHSTSGNYDPSKRKDGANLILAENLTNGLITFKEAIAQSIAVYGRVLLGAESNVVQLGTPSIGSTNWIGGGNVGVQPGWLVQYPGFFLWDAPTPPNGGLPFPPKGTYSLMGTTYTNSYHLASGNYHVFAGLSLTASEKILVSGHVKFHCSGDLKMLGQSQIIIATNSSLTLYAGGSVDLSGGGVINYTRFATNLTFNGLNTCIAIQYTGGADFIGTVYAPRAAFRMSGGGSTTYHLVGSVVANTISISGRYQIHLDESLFHWPVRAAALSSPTFSAGGAIQFRVTGVPGEDYVIEASTNQMDWLPVATNRSPFTFTNSSASAPQEFFRAMHTPPPWWLYTH